MSQPGMCAQMPLRDMVGECSRNVMRMAQEMRTLLKRVPSGTCVGGVLSEFPVRGSLRARGFESKCFFSRLLLVASALWDYTSEKTFSAWCYGFHESRTWFE